MEQAHREDHFTGLPEVLTVEEVARYLQLNRKTIYEAVSRNEIPHVKVGRAIRFHRDAMLQWLGYGKGCVSRSPKGTGQ